MIKLQPGEHIIRDVRRHWIVAVTEIIFIALLGLGGAAIVLAVFYFGAVPSTEENAAYAVFGLALWFLALWISGFALWTNYYLDVWIITNYKIIDVEQHRLFSREVSEYRIDRIQDVTASVDGLAATYLGYGNVDVQTAGESSGHFVIRQAPNPDEIKDLIMQLQNQASPPPNGVNAFPVKPDLSVRNP